MGFIGELLHTEMFDTTFPAASVVTTATETLDVEFEVFPESFMAMGMSKLPILKGYILMMDLSTGLSLVGAVGEFLEVYLEVYNCESSEIDNSKLLDRIHGFAAETAQGKTFNQERGNGNYGDDGILLRPTITVRCYLKNDTGTSIAADELEGFFNAIIDWTDVSESEFDEYLKELWFEEAFD